MSDDRVASQFKEAEEMVEDAHQQSVDALRKKVADAKADALKKIGA